MKTLDEHEAALLAYASIPVLAIAFLFNHALVEGYTWTVPGSLLGSLGALGAAIGIVEMSSEVRERFAFGTGVAFFIWAMVIIMKDAMGIPDPGQNIISGLYEVEIIEVYLNVVLLVGILAWATYVGEEVLSEYGWGESPEADELGMEVDEDGVPITEE